MDVIRWPGLLTTSNETRDVQRRRLAFVSLLIVCACIVFSQVTFIAINPARGSGAFALAPLIPITVGALILGTRTGVTLGIFSGLLLYLHTIIMPLHYLEFTLVSLSLNVVLFATYGLIIGLLFAITIPKAGSHWQEIGYILLDCFVTSTIVGLVIKLFTPYAPTFADTAMQIAVNTVVPAIVSIGIYFFARHLKTISDDIGVREAFNITLFIIASLVFIVDATVSYVTVTLREMEDTEAAITTEVNYLCLQLKSLEDRAAAFTRIADETELGTEAIKETYPEDFELLTDPIGDVLNGYTMEQTGTVVIVADGHVIATDDPRIPVGCGISELGSDTEDAIRASLQSSGVQPITYEGILTSKDNMGGHSQHKQIGYLLAGQQDDHTIVIIEPASMVFRERYRVIFHEISMAFSMLVVLFILGTRLLSMTVARRIDQTNEALAKITSGDLSVRVEVAGTREFKSLSAGINTTVDALNDLIAESERRIERDLKTAHNIQEGALPKHFPAFPDIDAVDLFASMDAAKQVGGDFYDFFEVNDHTVAFLIADVSGKGIPGALFMMVAKAEIQNFLSTGMDIAEAIGQANKYLCTHNEAGMFVTVWAATLDWQTGRLEYVNAGHNYPLLRHGRKGPWEWMTEKSGLFLGTFETIKYQKDTIVLEPDDELVLYTDGVNEAFNRNEEEYGNDRLEAFLIAHADERPREIAQNLRADVATWADGAEQSDDITIVVLEYRLGSESD